MMEDVLGFLSIFVAFKRDNKLLLSGNLDNFCMVSTELSFSGADIDTILLLGVKKHDSLLS